jgi:hypothetical protein
MRLPTAISSSKAGSTPGNVADGVCADASRRPAKSATATNTPAPASRLTHRTANFLVIILSLERLLLNRRQNRKRLASGP